LKNLIVFSLLCYSILLLGCKNLPESSPIYKEGDTVTFGYSSDKFGIIKSININKDHSSTYEYYIACYSYLIYSGWYPEDQLHPYSEKWLAPYRGKETEEDNSYIDESDTSEE
jgi:hypothetical protein